MEQHKQHVMKGISNTNSTCVLSTIEVLKTEMLIDAILESESEDASLEYEKLRCQIVQNQRELVQLVKRARRLQEKFEVLDGDLKLMEENNRMLAEML